MLLKQRTDAEAFTECRERFKRAAGGQGLLTVLGRRGGEQKEAQQVKTGRRRFLIIPS